MKSKIHLFLNMIKQMSELIVITDIWILKTEQYLTVSSALQNVGAELKTLMVSVDAEIVSLPVECHTEVSVCWILN